MARLPQEEILAARPSQEEILAAFHTETPMKVYAASIKMSPNTLRRVWKGAFGEEAFRERGRLLRSHAALRVCRKTISSRKYKKVDIECVSCGEMQTLTTQQTGQIKDLSRYQCKSCRGGYDRKCPVCGLEVNGAKGLSGHFRHRKEAKDEDHLSYLEAQEEAKWEGKSEDHEFVRCRLCEHRAVTLARHLKAVHGVTAEEYRNSFPGALIRSLALTQERSEALRRFHEGNISGKGEKKTELCPDCGKEQEVSKFASPEVHEMRCLECKEKKEAEEWAAKWKGLSAPEDYVECKVDGCGYRAESLVSHLQNVHPEFVGRYVDTFRSHLVSLSSKMREPPPTIKNYRRGDLLPFADKKGKVIVAKAADALDTNGTTIRRYCKALNLPTRNKLALQKEVLDRCAEALQEEYAWEWRHDSIRNSDTGRHFFFDGFFEKQNLVVEVHGAQHFKFVPTWHKTREGFLQSQEKDKLKKILAEALGFRYLMIRWDEDFRQPGYLKGRLFQIGAALPDLSVYQLLPGR